MKCPYCESGTNDFVPMNQTAEYSGIEMSVNRQGKKRMIPVGNRALTALVKAGIGVEMNVPLKAPGVRFADEGVIIFDLKQATDMNQPNACTETGLCLIPTPAYPFVEMPSGYFAS